MKNICVILLASLTTVVFASDDYKISKADKQVVKKFSCRNSVDGKVYQVKKMPSMKRVAVESIKSAVSKQTNPNEIITILVGKMNIPGNPSGTQALYTCTNGPILPLNLKK